MSTSPEADFDLEKLFLPAWAQESPDINRYAKYAGDTRPVDRDRKFDDRSSGRRAPRRDGPSRPGGSAGSGGGNRPSGGNRPAGPRREGDRGSRPGGGRGDFRRDGPRERRPEERREPALPLPEILVTLMPDDKGVDSLSRQIKMSGRSFPLFDIAQMILQKPERQQVRFEVKKKPDGTPVQPPFLCAVDDTLWLSEQEAVDHVLGKHFTMFYQAEKTPTDPPKGTYTFVAQCGMSGVILGPPNYHDYQNQLRKLHSERFSRMPFEAFKARVKIVREEAVVKKWVEDQSTKTEYLCLNVPEAPRIATREAVEVHFREVHLANIIKPVERHTLSGPASRQLRSPGLQRLLRAAWEEQKRFPLQIATVLSQQFASHGLQFFKVNKTITHVSVARPHYLDLDATPVSAQVKQIVQFIDATPKCTRRQLVAKLAPSPAPAPIPVTPDAAPAPAGSPPAEPAPTPEQAAIIGDLHWLIHQGHVIEFANGILETAKKPLVKPPRPPKPPTKAEIKPAADTTPGLGSEDPTVIIQRDTTELDAEMAEPSHDSATTAPSEAPAEIAAGSEDVTIIIKRPTPDIAVEPPTQEPEPAGEPAKTSAPTEPVAIAPAEPAPAPGPVAGPPHEAAAT
jgi:hypothetical protein